MNHARETADAVHKIDLYFDTGHDADLLEWYRSFVSEAQAKNIWLSLAEAVLGEGEIRLDAFAGDGAVSGERQQVRLRIHARYFPAIAHVWSYAKSGSRSATVIAALRHAMLDVREGKRGVKVAILTGTGTGQALPRVGHDPAATQPESTSAHDGLPADQEPVADAEAGQVPATPVEADAPVAEADDIPAPAAAAHDEGFEEFDDDLPSGDLVGDGGCGDLLASLDSIKDEDEEAEVSS